MFFCKVDRGSIRFTWAHSNLIRLENWKYGIYMCECILPGTLSEINEINEYLRGRHFHQFCTIHGALLTHWDRVTHICVSKLTTIGLDNGLSPGWRQAIICTNAGIMLIRTLGTNFSEILCEIHSFPFSKMHLKMSSAKWRLFGLGLNELKILLRTYPIEMLMHYW